MGKQFRNLILQDEWIPAAKLRQKLAERVRVEIDNSSKPGDMLRGNNVRILTPSMSRRFKTHIRGGEA